MSSRFHRYRGEVKVGTLGYLAKWTVKWHPCVLTFEVHVALVLLCVCLDISHKRSGVADTLIRDIIDTQIWMLCCFL